MWETDDSASSRACERDLLQWGSRRVSSIACLRFLPHVQELPIMLVCEEPDLRSPQVDPPGVFSRKNKAEETCLLGLQLEQPLDCREQKGGVQRICVMGQKENK